jgi:hypothetical protein
MDKQPSLFCLCVIDKKNSLITLPPGVNVIKPFSLSLTQPVSKLMRLQERPSVTLSLDSWPYLQILYYTEK